jgi:hypothetical protein
MGTFAESGDSNRQGPDGGESMSYNDDSNSIDPEQTPNPRPGPTESAGPTGWLDALNSFLEGAFLKADVDTGC